jgi:hypothetical protein
MWGGVLQFTEQCPKCPPSAAVLGQKGSSVAGVRSVLPARSLTALEPSNNAERDQGQGFVDQIVARPEAEGPGPIEFSRMVLEEGIRVRPDVVGLR